MGVDDGNIMGTHKVVDNGSPTKRFNLVLVAEGYTEDQLNDFASDVDQFVNILFATQPFDEYKKAINIYRIDVASDESGADDPTACGGSGAAPKTYFDASFCNGGIHRLLLVDSALAINVVSSQVPQWHQIIVVVNTSMWGGAGGSIATTSTAIGWENIAIHEIGHAAFYLADEYEYYVGCGSDVGHDNYTGSEPAAVNITKDNNRNTIKWADLIQPTTPVPTTSNPNCTQCDFQASPVPPGTVGAFEGAGYNHCGLYRPEYHCMMRDLSPFCAVCRRTIKEKLKPYMPHFSYEFLELFLEKPQFLEKWILVAYLLVDWRIHMDEQIRFNPDERFYNVLSTYVGAYLTEGIMPPSTIASAIINIGDDIMAGKQITLRAGDYIAIQNFARKTQRQKTV